MTKPTREEAEQAVKTLIAWAGDDVSREGLSETPQRVVESYKELFSGYNVNPAEFLVKTFSETESYREMIILKDISVESHCEHHMLPIIGKATIAYIPNDRVVGISKLARVVDAFAKRLQIQEKLTAQIANTIDSALKPRGVAVVIDAEHHCMTVRGVHKTGVKMRTSHITGCFETNSKTRQEFFNLLK
jgi:GTP cyclohydrolase I